MPSRKLVYPEQSKFKG